MNPQLLPTSRKALFTATLTMVGVLMLVFVYWVLALHGVLPSPGRPLLAKPVASPALTNQMAFQAPAESPATQPAPDLTPAKPSAAAQPPKEEALQTPHSAPAPAGMAARPDNLAAIADASRPAIVVTNQPPPPLAQTPATSANPPTKQVGGPLPLTLPETTWQDENIARRWAASTNERPVVRVFYARADILELLRSGRGILVASLGGDRDKKRREFCLTTLPGVPPEYTAFTANQARGFAKFGIGLRPEGEMARLAGPLPGYFGGEAEGIFLEFVPDWELGREIYTQVARAMRGVKAAPEQQGGWIYEGELRVKSGRPQFQMHRVRGANQEYVLE